MKIKLDTNLIKYISLVESVTKAKVKDCFVDSQDTLVCVVENGEIVKAIGKNGANAIKLKEMIKRKLKIIEYNPKLDVFIKSLILPFKVDSIEIDNNIVHLRSNDTRTKGLLIGKSAGNLRNYEKILQRFFPEIEEIKVE